MKIIALFFVFFVVIFFWMSSHQNGLTMTFFARDYTQATVGKWTNIWFDLFTLLPLGLAVLGVVLLIRKVSEIKTRLLGLAFFVVFTLIAYYRFNGFWLLSIHLLKNPAH
jgi:POT family proton-dependent oligopeptide transporter